MLNNNTIRVYAGFRDLVGVSRIGFVDLDAQDPSKILRMSQKPALDIGAPGCFDDNGVILGDLLWVKNTLYLYYVGFQLVNNVKFLAYTGLAISEDGGDTFVRLSAVPVLDRANEALYFRAIHSIRIEEGIWKCWYGAGSKWSEINGIQYPNYITQYIESSDGINFPEEGEICIDQEGEDEYQIGRPRVSKIHNRYQMFYTIGTLGGSYLPGYAESNDGKVWVRKDDLVGIKTSDSGWNSKDLSYAAPLKVEDKEYLFYNGNDMGKTGFGYAERNLKD